VADRSLGRAAAFAAAALAGLALLAGPAFSKPSTSSHAIPALYTTAQAATGAKAYAAKCAQCHGANLEGGVGPALTGPNLVRLAKKTKLTVGDMFQFMALQMPLDAPASLPKAQYAAIMAFVLKFNGYPSGSKPLTYDGAMKSPVIITTYGK
jgi:polar amino acid transport system substrate-binding protein